MKSNKKEKWLLQQVGPPLSTIARSSLKSVTATVSSEVDAVLICSYNWRESQSPAIHVPGGAAKWMGGTLPTVVPPDTGRQFVDQDGAKIPNQPFETVFRALEVQNPEYRFDSIDVLVNRNSLRKLLSFCHGSKQDTFRIHLHAVKDTLIIERCEKNAVEVIGKSRRAGFGHNFERSFTTFQQGLEDSTAHHRVLEYKLGDLRMAVRFEVDASYDPSPEDEKQTTIPLEIEPKEDLAQLGNDLRSLQLSSPSEPAPKPKQTTSLLVAQSGGGTVQAQTAEIKTGQVSMGRTFAQMWFGRTPYLIRGTHMHGTFSKVEIRHMDKELVKWEKDAKHQLALRKLVDLLTTLRRTTTTSSNRSAILILRKDNPEKIEIFHRNSKQLPLPGSIIAKFWEAK